MTSPTPLPGATEPTEGTYLERYLRNGSLITFEERPTGYRAYHYQPADGERKRLISVTSVLGVLDKPALMRWSEEQGIRGAAEAIRRAYIDPRPEPDELLHAVRANNLGADGARDRAAGRGLDTHSVLEGWMRTGSPPNPADYPAEHRGYIQGLARALLELDPEPTQVEQLVAHADLGYAGRYDLRARIDGRDTLVDLKTNRGGKAYPEASVQLAGYAMAAEWCFEPPPERLLVVAVGEDGSFDVTECSAQPEHWLAVLGCYEAMKVVRRPIEAAARAAKKAARQEAKAA